MSWHYAINGETRGPVGDDEFQSLVQQGVITRETLVWREGMASWAPHGAGSASLPPTPGAGLQDDVACAMCGRIISKNDAFVLSGVSYCAACKPQVLQRLREGVDLGGSRAEEIRNSHIKHEASVKSIGVLYLLGGGALLLVGIGTAISAFAPHGKLETLALAAIIFVLGIGQIWVGLGIRSLRPWTRIATGILSGIGLLGFPVGTIINGYILYLVFSQKGTTVFSPEYQEIIRQTPHIKYKTSIVVWIILGLLLFVIVIGVTAAIFSK